MSKTGTILGKLKKTFGSRYTHGRFVISPRTRGVGILRGKYDSGLVIGSKTTVVIAVLKISIK